MLEILQKLSKSGDQFTAIADLQNNKEHVLFQAWYRQLSRKFSEQVYSPYKLSILVSRDKDTLSAAILEDFDLHGKLNSFEIPRVCKFISNA